MYLIFSDLDGTLLDEDTYSFQEATEAIEFLKEKEIPLILCSSKTRFEMELYREKMDIMTYPFIPENGGAIFIPKTKLNLHDFEYKVIDKYQVIEIGKPHEVIKKKFQEILNRLGFQIKGFSQMEAKEISKLSGLPLKEAKLAAQREYSEPFIFKNDKYKFFLLEEAIKKYGLKLTKGNRFYSISWGSDKGKAVQILKSIYQQTYSHKTIISVGIGDSPNDIPMLKEVDVPVVVRRKSGKYQVCDLENVYYTQKIGPRGWSEAIYEILRR